MKFLLSLLLIVLLSFSAYSQESNENQNNLNMMEIILFLNANQLPEGAESFKVDKEKKLRQYFDKDGLLIEEGYITADNNIISKKYDKEGEVISETVITEKALLESQNRAQPYHSQNVVPEIESTLQALSKAAETFAKDHNNNYPDSMRNLTEPNPPYLDECTCDQSIKMYRILCELNSSGYSFIAHSIWEHKESYAITTGSKWEVKKPGELGRAIPFKPSKSPCVE